MAEDNNEDPKDIYDEEVMDELEENDEISPEEEAFMKGYKEAEKTEIPKKKKVEEKSKK